MEKDQKILIGIISIILVVAIGICIYLFVNRDSKKLTDGEKFAKEYEALNGERFVLENGEYQNYINVEMDDNNIYKYKSEKEIIDILENKTGVIYLGFPACPRCRNLINPLMEVAKENDVKEIYYLNIEDIRDTYEVVNGNAMQSIKGTESYYKLLKILDEYLEYYTIKDDDNNEYNTGEKRLYASTVITVKDGEIVGFHVSTVENQNILEPLTKDETKELKSIYEDMIKEMKKVTVCTDTGC